MRSDDGAMRDDASWMTRALDLAVRGQGCVEPNPMVGCVLVNKGRVVGEGWHASFGGPHAEAVALRAAGRAARDATVFVTLEPCCHHGKTPPCTKDLIHAGVRRVVIAEQDIFHKVDGGGIAELKAAGLDVVVGLKEDDARWLNAPYRKLIRTGRPWIVAKWAMTLDGKIATSEGDSQWISCEASREIVHTLRGRMDAIVVGSRTAHIDNPVLTPRPPGTRTPTRIVVDTSASLPLDSRLVRSARETPVLVACGESVPEEAVRGLTDAGVEVMRCAGSNSHQRLGWLLDELGRRQMTNLLVEGGGELLGSLLDIGAIDEVHCFIGPKIVGGRQARSPFAGVGVPRIEMARIVDRLSVKRIGQDIYLTGRTRETT
ncbi:MAG: bifunctional diaminohydroxyphosphoribosylaminopyrimidine deaminase/5-amino-6-(5-phosphoribosylamino)uracil reductase RibD [Pirellulales bacterium]